jgi:hypothetical protein
MDTGAIISTIKGTGTSTEQNMVLDMAKSYEDAGILPTDSLSTATEKLKKSKIYLDKVRPPVGAGGGGTNTDDVNGYVDMIMNGDFVKRDSKGNILLDSGGNAIINWSSIPAKIRTDVNSVLQQKLQQEQQNNPPPAPEKKWYEADWLGKIPFIK